MRRLALLLPLVVACRGELTAPPVDTAAEEFAPPAVYQTWWNLTQSCSGLSGDMGRVKWFIMPKVKVFLLNDQYVSGYWSSADNRIVLAQAVVDQGPSVRHEMLHALLGRNAPGHPRAAFVGKCGGTVYCSSQCVSDGGSAPPANPAAIQLRPEDLDITVEVTPAHPSSLVDDGHIVMVVSAANRSGKPAEVNLGPSNSGIAFSFQLTSDNGFFWWGGVPVTAPETTRFAAGEKKRYVFDFQIAVNDGNVFPGGSNLAPGIYSFAGAYGGTWAANPPTLTLIR